MRNNHYYPPIYINFQLKSSLYFFHNIFHNLYFLFYYQFRNVKLHQLFKFKFHFQHIQELINKSITFSYFGDYFSK
jgi:hypothetical protein